jgi:hypothetical protein
MAAAHVPETIRCLIWNEAFQAATLLDGLMEWMSMASKRLAGSIG